ncbi:DUF4190 domain-containing protein [Solirubrobacter sp. CPCC 204708]|uniref:DUF4190 domain-containing protein n=1 Tax=Solirubrobacter deserti TaxID=2282478 RepID=A0ABT4RKW9_9ACTN|nr:DUF4190 domain-containing protein [Solirubrobacter deserti]MBE2319066.1 DUF4190 domain-containing protein [Solirubrobacter deserti]MDA0139145.1 DUF4190 domain-containing protein [Solirubrobacter deserti]
MSTPSDDDPPYKPPQWQQPEQQPSEQGGWQSSWQQPQEKPQQQGGWQSQWQQPQENQWQQQPQQNQWQQQQTPQWGGYQPAPPTPGNAIASLILGIVSIVLCPIIPGVVGLVLGYSAKREIDASGGRLGGRGVAMGGIITSWIGLAIWGLLIAFWVIAIAASA